MAGRAGFNLEFLPSIYMDKKYAADNRLFGVFRASPQEQMHRVPPSMDDPKQFAYLEQWDEAMGYTRPLPIVTGNRTSWGNSIDVADLGVRMYFLHKAFPGIVGVE